MYSLGSSDSNHNSESHLTSNIWSVSIPRYGMYAETQVPLVIGINKELSLGNRPAVASCPRWQTKRETMEDASSLKRNVK